MTKLCWVLMGSSYSKWEEKKKIPRYKILLRLIFAGVIGGLIGFGLVGIFAGPVLLAVTYTLLKAWLAENTAENTAEPATDAARTPLRRLRPRRARTGSRR